MYDIWMNGVPLCPGIETKEAGIIIFELFQKFLPDHKDLTIWSVHGTSSFQLDPTEDYDFMYVDDGKKALAIDGRFELDFETTLSRLGELYEFCKDRYTLDCDLGSQTDAKKFFDSLQEIRNIAAISLKNNLK